MTRIRRWSLLLLLLLIGSTVVPSSPGTSGVQAAPASQTPPLPQQVKVPPISDPHLPNLSLHIETSPTTVILGDTATITVTVSNQAPDAAQTLRVSLPTPDGTVPIPGDGFVSASKGWEWSLGRLEGFATTTVSATLRVNQMPAGEALVATATASAYGLTRAVSNEGGALVIDRTRGASQVTFTPGQAAHLRSADSRVNVRVPGKAKKQHLTLEHRSQPKDDDPKVPAIAGYKRGLDAFFLHATDNRGTAIHQFDAPLSLAVSYTDEQLRALGISEGDLTLFWFDEEASGTPSGAWVPIDTTVDSTTNTATSEVDHFSAFKLGDGSSPSASYLPSLKGAQTSLFMGSAAYSMPIKVPAGPAGMKPDLTLSYTSAATDGPTGQRPKQQAGWAGLGWNMTTPTIAQHKQIVNDGTGEAVSYYTMVLDGKSHDLVRAEATVATPNENKITDWVWRPTSESYLKIRAVSNGASTDHAASVPQNTVYDHINNASYGRGGHVNGTWQPRTSWRIRAKDGTLYEFSEDLWWGWDRCASLNEVAIEPYKWLLSKVTDTNGNTITYQYTRQSWVGWEMRCDWSRYGRGTVDRAAWPSSITWGGNVYTGAPDRYKVEFRSVGRGSVDAQFEGAANQYGGVNGQPRETQILQAVDVMSNGGNGWELVRSYRFETDTSLRSDQTINTNQANNEFPRLTLTKVTEVGKDGATALPSTTFSYGTERGIDAIPNANWNRLKLVDNGYGGTTEFQYQQLEAATGKTIFRNYRRVTSRIERDGQGQSSTWSYAYNAPALNSLGRNLTGATDGNATQDHPNSGALYFNKYWDPAHPYQQWLKTGPMKEFRGHSQVTETNPSGGWTEHYFYQGDVGCTPTSSGSHATIDADPCFRQLRDREFLVGREYKTRVFNAGAANPLSETEHNFVVEFKDYGPQPLSGLWRSWDYERETTERTSEGTGTPVTKRTLYTYDEDQTNWTGANWTSTKYGNLSRMEEFDQTGALIRRTKHYYAVRDDTTVPSVGSGYLVDKKWATVVFDGSWNALSYEAFFYDGATDPKVMGTQGRLTRTSTLYYDGSSAPLTGTTNSADTTYGYDSYGNKTTVTTYANAGTSSVSNGVRVWSAPGNNNTSFTTTTTYDGTFHAFPVQVDPPLVNVPLTEKAEYDYRMGTLTKVTDPNTNATTATYDLFGRLRTIVKPGDTSTAPTIDANYDDWEYKLAGRPFKYFVCQREIAGQGNCRPTTKFYDGLGREIQTKMESAEGTQSIVTDKVYDGLGNVARSSQARYVNETGDAFWRMSARGTDSEMRWTTMSYDALSRPVKTTNPDTTFRSYHYGIYEGLIYHNVTDENRHRTYSMYDSLGRRMKVRELSGDCGNYWADYTCSGSYTTAWANNATTTYRYTRADLLDQVTDQHGNVTSMSYDARGRKYSMSDPDMGAWHYSYDVNGNLRFQTDAKGQKTEFRYDPLDRLRYKLTPDGRYSEYGYDEGYGFGKGHRTSTSTYLYNVNQSYRSFFYDARGRVVEQGNIVDGMTGVRTLKWTYDSADRVATMTYPTGEQVNYSYDSAWRPTSVCTSGGGCYASNAQYTALDQPTQRTVSNGTVQHWMYTSPMQRLQRTYLTASNQFDRTYSYDGVGNVKNIRDNVLGQTQNFGYDHRDRLTNAWTTESTTNAYNEVNGYDTIGNLTMKASIDQGYGQQSASCAAGALVKPHAIVTRGIGTFCYDQNGNMVTGGGRTITWNADNQPTRVAQNGLTEDYAYDADSERITRTANGVTTVYIGGVYEEDIQTDTKRVQYQFNGQVVAQRTNSSTGTKLNYLFADHLGSVSVASNEGGTSYTKQDFTPWGEVRSGGISDTTLNYTGQRRDSTGLLYYHARYYDPTTARFLSADSVVPGAPDGSMDGVALKPLTVDFHEPGFVVGVNSENKLALPFQDREQIKPWGPQNAQALNRYSYVQNNPLKYTDPTGHTRDCDEVGDPNCGHVRNESSQDILIRGDRRKDGCQGNGSNCYDENVTMVLPAGMSSDDLGFVDVDFVRAVDDQHPIAGRGVDEMYKLSNGTTVYIRDDGRGGVTLTDVQSRWNKIKVQLGVILKGNEPPGWYSSDRYDWTPKPRRRSGR